MKINKTKVLAIIILIAGLGLLSYPFVSNYLNSLYQTKTVDKYRLAVDLLKDEEIKKIKEQYDEFNREIVDTVVLTDPFDENAIKKSNGIYKELEKIFDNGLMGAVEIPSIKVSLPIYFGTSDKVLKKGVGHLENTSIPTGKVGTHSVFSSHTALPSSKLFNDLNKVKVGDTFNIEILNDKFYYRVDQVKVVLPNEVSDLSIEKDKDYVTLLTCTPYGINSHRLLVRGERFDYYDIDDTPVKHHLIADIVVLSLIGMTIELITRKIIKGKKNEEDN